VHQGDVSVYIENVDLIYLRQKYNYKEHEEEKKTIETDRGKPLLNALKLVGISRRDRIPNCRGIFQLDLASEKYSTYEKSREENLKIMKRIRPNSFMHSENMKST
jgi:hypothetical protein